MAQPATALLPRPRLLVPVLRMTDRLRTRSRLQVLVGVLLVPSLLAAGSFTTVIGGQVAFAESERAGVRVVGPAVQALASSAAGHTPDLTDLQAAVAAHPELGEERALAAVVQAPDASALAALVAQVNDRLHLLRELGVLVALDDFSTGYSCLSYLRSLPVDVLKIDRSFVSGTAAGDAPLVRTIVELGNALGLSTTAEGIETAAQSALLRQLGCESGQGYFYSRPLSAAAATDNLAAPLLLRARAESTRRPARATRAAPAAAGLSAGRSSRSHQQAGNRERQQHRRELVGPVLGQHEGGAGGVAASRVVRTVSGRQQHDRQRPCRRVLPHSLEHRPARAS